jgi:hypothetical protein
VRPDHPRQLFGPFALWQVSDVPFDASENYLIVLFYRPVGLRVVDRSEALLGAQISTEVLEVGAVELFAIVHSDFVWHAEAAHHVLQEEFLYCCRSNA